MGWNRNDRELSPVIQPSMLTQATNRQPASM